MTCRATGNRETVMTLVSLPAAVSEHVRMARHRWVCAAALNPELEHAWRLVSKIKQATVAMRSHALVPRPFRIGPESSPPSPCARRWSGGATETIARARREETSSHARGDHETARHPCCGN